MARPITSPLLSGNDRKDEIRLRNILWKHKLTQSDIARKPRVNMTPQAVGQVIRRKCNLSKVIRELERLEGYGESTKPNAA